jgi:2Fe-2S ferredoxin
LFVTNRDGVEIAIDGQAGLTVMEVIRAADVHELLALCGGCCSCGTCHVYVDPSIVDRLAPVGQSERDLLDSLDHCRPTSRLSCQILLGDALSGLKLTIAPGE